MRSIIEFDDVVAGYTPSFTILNETDARGARAARSRCCSVPTAPASPPC